MNLLAKSAVALSLLAVANVASATTYSANAGNLTASGYSYDLSSFAIGDILNIAFNLSQSADVTYGISDVTTANGTKGTYKFSLAVDGDNYDTSGSAITGGSAYQNDVAAGSYLLSYIIKSTKFNGLTQSGTISLSSSIAAVPEPETYALMGVGLLGLLAARRRKAMVS